MMWKLPLWAASTHLPSEETVKPAEVQEESRQRDPVEAEGEETESRVLTSESTESGAASGSPRPMWISFSSC